MRVLLTGGSGFIGGRIAALLRARGDDVVALVRSPERAPALRGLGCELAAGTVTEASALARAAAGADAVIHAAGMYEIGVGKGRRDAMFDANVTGTRRVLQAAVEAGVGRIVHVSTMNVFGDTGGRVAEGPDPAPRISFLSLYDRTKYEAHLVAKAVAAAGAPVVVAAPGGVYGPGDHSEIGRVIRQAASGTLGYVSFPDLGMSMAHVDDIAAGIVLVCDSGRAGRTYVLGGERVRMRDLVRRAALAGGRRPPRVTMPTAMVRLLAVGGPRVARLLKLPPNLAEVVSASNGVTYWASDAIARAELGYRSRPLDEGLRQSVAS